MTPASIASLLQHPALVSAFLLTCSNLFMTFDVDVLFRN
jgi:uncharacterized protein (DUF486 family)